MKNLNQLGFEKGADGEGFPTLGVDKKLENSNQTKIKENQKTAGEVRHIFSSIADNYDKANKAITLGMDQSWRKKLVTFSEAPQTACILDCGTGTGALAFEFQRQLGSLAQITGVDFCEEMLTKAREYAQQNQTFKNIRFQQADVQNLPFLDNSFDVSVIAYGLRNMTDPVLALKEMARVTRSTGKVMILETGDRPFLLVYPFFYLYFRYVVPYLGGWITGQRSAYHYLQKSSKGFPSRGALLKMVRQTGCFSHCEYRTLFFGASFIYKAIVS